MSAVKITADSTCDLTQELVARYDVTIIPLYVEMDGKSLRDGIDLQPREVCEYFDRTGTLAKTSAVSVNDYIELFRPLVREGCAVVHFTISSEMSSCYQNACLAAQEVGGEIYVVDSRNLSTGIALLAIKAAELARQGKSAREIYDTVTALTGKLRVSFVIDTLEYLAKGGRCSTVVALGANLLKLKPCIEVKDGVMDVSKKYRGQIGKVVPQYIADELSKPQEPDLSRIFITHSSCTPQVVEAAREAVAAAAPFAEILETTAGCTITSHCGPNTLGILYLVK